MAEQIPFNIIADILTKLGSSAIQEIRSVYSVPKELRKLEEKLDTIKGVLLDAEEKQEKSHAVKAWVRRLKDVVYDADDLLDDFATHHLQRGGVARQVRDFFSSSNQVAFPFKMSNRVKDIIRKVDDIAKEIPILNLIQRDVIYRRVENSWRDTHSFVLTSEIVGRDKDKEEIIKLLLSFDNLEILSMVAIVGIGGLGKTTLAQLVYNDPRVVQFFELKIWVCVSDNFEVKQLVKSILQSISKEDVERLKLDVLKDRLHEKISQKRCLLVLDDVWNEIFEKWDQLRILLMVVGKGSKILVTTRKSNVASIMRIDRPIILQGLEENQSWDLFSKFAFRQEQGNGGRELEEIGKEIVKMCNGVPLVIKTLGATLQSKTDKGQWLSIKNNRNLLQSRDGNDNILSVLKLSYDNLPIHLKQCFAYCGLFPKDYKIEKKLLVQLWMAQGYIQPLDANLGNQYFEELLSRSLFHEVERNDYNDISSCKMHDLVHDLAESIIGSELLVLRNDVKEILGRVHHVSWFESLNIGRKALKAKCLRTFLKLSKYDDNIDLKFSTLIPSFKRLRVLGMQRFEIMKVPKSLGQLSHLRYLDLSRNTFKVLPNAIIRLNNLQTLNLGWCEFLKEFPEDIRKLINLRHLENDGCWGLTHMPCGIGELTLLQSLPLFIIGNVGSERGRLGDDGKIGRLSELKGLDKLKGELRIETLENVEDAVLESREANLGTKQHIQSLGLKWSYDTGAQSSEDAKSLLEGLQPHQNLKELSVEGYGGVRFPSWMMNGGLSSMLPNLITINLSRCSRCEILPCFVRLLHLKSLKLYNLEKVECMECSSEGPFFPSLEKLYLGGMPKLKELWRWDLTREPPPSFPCLSQLIIWGCHNLTSLSLPPSPLLSWLEIKRCDDFASLELHSSLFLSVLEIRHCPKLSLLRLPPSPVLSKLEIEFCGDLTSVQLHSSPLLSGLKISLCPKLTSLLLPPSPLLSKLEIYNCDDLASLELCSSPLLSRIEIWICPKLTSLLLPPSPHLSKLEIKYCDDLTFLELHPCPFLSNIEITSCPKLASFNVPSLPCLKTLELASVKEEVSRQLLFATASSLEYLSIERIDDLTSLPHELLQHVSTLQTLFILGCPGLATLPHWIGSFASLTHFRISKCPELTSLPEEICSLENLQILEIFDCPHLVERCRKETGEEWPKIAHLPSICIR